MNREAMTMKIGAGRKNPSPFIRSSILALAVVAALSIAPLPAAAELVDFVAAAVNNEVITASELSHVIALNTQLGAGDQDRTALRAETLNGLITRQLLVQEARRLRFVDVTDQEVAAEIEKMKKRFPTEAAYAFFLQAQGMTERELGRILGERLLVERFVEKKVGLFVRVSREEAQEYYDSHAAEFRGRTFQEVQKTITALLTDRKVGSQINQYVAELRSKADIRVNPQPPQ